MNAIESCFKGTTEDTIVRCFENRSQISRFTIFSNRVRICRFDAQLGVYKYGGKLKEEL